MDLNELLHAHQVEVMRAAASGSDEKRQSHFDKVALYVERIRQLRASLLATSPLPLSEPGETIIYGTYAGDPLPDEGMAPQDSRRGESDSPDPWQIPQPLGVTTMLRREYHVGPYVYSDVSLAMAEYERQRLMEPR